MVIGPRLALILIAEDGWAFCLGELTVEPAGKRHIPYYLKCAGADQQLCPRVVTQVRLSVTLTVALRVHPKFPREYSVFAQNCLASAQPLTSLIRSTILAILP